MDAILLCQVFYGIGAAVSIGGVLFPDFREQIMNYGSRKSSNSKRDVEGEERRSKERLLHHIASSQVPHAWFTHYYVISVFSTVFWAYQILFNGRAFQLLAYFSKQTSPPMTLNQVVLSWSLMAFQGCRRLYESLTFTKPSKSLMWSGLWLIGMAYYGAMGLSIWIEGLPTLRKPWSLSDVEFAKPSAKTMVGLPLFFTSTIVQHICHKHLASLKKYSMPFHPFFQYIVCPHYTSECLIYLAIAIVAAPREQILNGSVMAGLAFVTSNLAVTADGTRKWYIDRFGAETLGNRRRIVPYIF